MKQYADFLDMQGTRFWATRDPMPKWMGSDYLVCVREVGGPLTAPKERISEREFLKRWPEASHVRWHGDWKAFQEHISLMRQGT